MKNPDVYTLIKSLSKNESGYFTKYIGKNNSTYAKLFKLMLNQKIYNEKELIESFDKGYVGGNFSFAKNYLYKLVIKSLIQFNAHKNEAYQQFNGIVLLYRKGLYKQCAKMIKQVIKTARKTDDFLTMLRAIQYIKYLNHNNIYFDDNLEKFLTIEPEILHNQHTISTYQSLLSKIKRIRHKTGNMKKDESILGALEIVQHPLMGNKKELINGYAKQMYHETLFLCGYVLQDFELTRSHFNPLQKIIESPGSNTFLNDYQKADVFKQLIRFNILNKEFNKAKQNLINIRGILNDSSLINQTEKTAIYADCINFDLDIIINERDMSQSEFLLRQSEKFVKNNKSSIPPKFFIVYSSNLIIINFVLKKYKEVSKLINKVLSNDSKKLRKDIIISVMLTEIVVFYEMEKITLFENRLLGFNRFLKQNKIKEIVWVLFYNLLHDLQLNKNQKLVFNSFLNEISKMPKSRILIDILFLVDWAKEKTTKHHQ